MKIDDQTLKEILLKLKYVSAEDLSRAEKEARKRRLKLLDYLMENKIITRPLFGQALAEAAGVGYFDLSAKPPAEEMVLKIPQNSAQKYQLVLAAEDEKKVVAATSEPKKRGLKKFLAKLFPGKKIEIAFSLPEDIEESFIYYRKELKTRFGEIIKKEAKVAPEIIEEIFKDAVELKASDIHFEPQEEEVVVRFRIDGVLHEAARIKKEYFENILNRLKVTAHLRIDEHFAMQDGAIRFAEDGRETEMRVSVVPTIDGEKVVIRLLSEYIKRFGLSDLGLGSKDQEKIIKAVKKPFGMVLVVGPTGSGKTTTLYSILKTINSPEINITTIEDPVEYKLEGANHIQVNPAAGITFVKGLRSIVRQDPDVILVGEIRDRDTAEIAVNAALTGHLLFSTFHANDAPTAIPRLLEMKIEPFLIASTLEIVIAERLARRICESCRYSVAYEAKKLKKLLPDYEKYFSNGEATLYQGKGCGSCHQTGYKGRIGIFELMVISREMKDLILKDPSVDQIWQLAKKEGDKSLFEDGLEKVKAGLITLEELVRVASPTEIQ